MFVLFCRRVCGDVFCDWRLSLHRLTVCRDGGGVWFHQKFYISHHGLGGCWSSPIRYSPTLFECLETLATFSLYSTSLPDKFLMTWISIKMAAALYFPCNRDWLTFIYSNVLKHFPWMCSPGKMVGRVLTLVLVCMRYSYLLLMCFHTIS